jgi:hypothetical protein
VVRVQRDEPSLLETRKTPATTIHADNELALAA